MCDLITSPWDPQICKKKIVTDYSARNVNHPTLSIIFCQILPVQPKYTHTQTYIQTHRDCVIIKRLIYPLAKVGVALWHFFLIKVEQDREKLMSTT